MEFIIHFPETRWDYLGSRDSYSINLHPSPRLISKAYMALIKTFGWQSFTILYQVQTQSLEMDKILLQDNEGLIRLQELLKSSTDSDLRTVVHQLSFEDKDDNKKILREVKRSGAVHIVLDCELEKLRTVLKDAQVGI